MMTLLTDVEREDCISQLELEDELERRARINGLKYFVPTGVQENFIKKIGSGNIFVGIFSGGNRAGKTGLAINTLGNIIWGQQNEFFNHPIFKNWKHPKRARIGSSPKDLEEIGSIQTEIESWWNPEKYVASKNNKTYNALYKCDNGWIFDLMSYEQSVTEWESVGLGLVIFNEPPPKAIFDATIVRLGDGGMILIFMTPLSDAGYLFDDLIGSHTGLKKEQLTAIEYCDIEDSCVEHGIRGFREHDKIETILTFLDPEDVEARAHGKPMHLSGRIYKIFNDSVHIVDDFEVPKDWTRINIIDPHDAFPFSMLWCAIDKTGDYYIYDEYPNEPFEKIKGTSLIYKDYADAIRIKEDSNQIARRIIDPNFGAKKMGNTGKTVQMEMAILGIRCELCQTDNLDVGHNSVKDKLKYDTSKPISAINKPKLFVFRSCRNTWLSMLRYGTRPNKSGELTDNIKLIQTYKHFADLVRYLCVSAPQYQAEVIDTLKDLPALEQRVWRAKGENENRQNCGSYDSVLGGDND